MSSAIIIPSNREESFNKWCELWKNKIGDATVFLIEDSQDRTFEPKLDNFRYYCWRDIDNDLGENSWIIPRKTDCIRSYGYLKAYQEGFDYIMTMDDDCYPETDTLDWIGSHVKQLNETKTKWTNTLTTTKVRGIPFFNKGKLNVAISHGLWKNVADLDAPTQLTRGDWFTGDDEYLDKCIPTGTYYPMCGMNLAWKREVTPIMYFLLMGKEYGIDRFGDIWCGIISKKILDHLGYVVHSGYPYIWHNRASNVFVNLEKEAHGIGLNETFWEAVDAVILTKYTFKDCYWELADKLNLSGEYFEKLKQAMKVWRTLF